MTSAADTGIGARSDEDILRRYWHPVALAGDVSDHPVRTRLLDQDVVLWRAGDQIAAFRDLCVHRGVPLSMGTVDGTLIQCGFHGWTYDATGVCVRIPSIGTSRAIPAKARAIVYRAVEHHGLVWVCLGDPIFDLPMFPPEFGDASFSADGWLVADVAANAARFVENTMDQSHFAFIHAGILAVEPEVSPVVVEELDDGFKYAVENPHNTIKTGGPREWTAYRLTVPFTLFLERYRPGDPERQVLAFLSSPISSRATRVFRNAVRNFRRFSVAEEAERAMLIFEQDRAFVEAQRPEELPLDLREELHVRGPDGAAIEYRRLLRRLGVTWQ